MVRSVHKGEELAELAEQPLLIKLSFYETATVQNQLSENKRQNK